MPMHPKPSAETTRPWVPSWRCSIMGGSVWGFTSRPGHAWKRSRGCRSPPLYDLQPRRGGHSGRDLEVHGADAYGVEPEGHGSRLLRHEQQLDEVKVGGELGPVLPQQPC